MRNVNCRGKRAFAVLALCALLGSSASTASAQTAPSGSTPNFGLRVPGFPGIPGVPWDASREAAKKAMLAQGFTFNAAQSTKDALTFTGGKVAGYPVAVVVLEFCKEGFWNAGVVFARGDTNKTVAFYKQVQAQFVAKFGPPTQKFEYFDAPYFEGDGYEKPALIVGKGHFQSFWQFDNKRDGFFLVINRDLTITLTYEYVIREAEVKAAAEKTPAEKGATSLARP